MLSNKRLKQRGAVVVFIPTCHAYFTEIADMFSAGTPDGLPSIRTEGGRIWRPEFGGRFPDSVESAVILVTTPSMRKWTSDVDVGDTTLSIVVR